MRVLDTNPSPCPHRSSASGTTVALKCRMDFLHYLIATAGQAVSDGRIPWPGVLWLGFTLWVWSRYSPESRRSGSDADEITEMQRAVHSEPHEFAPVRVEDFRWLDARYYDAAERRLEAAGFRCLGDLENISLSAAFPNLRTAIRNFTGDDGVVTAGVWQVKLRGWLRVPAFLRLVKGDMRVTEFCTEFSDGAFIATLDNLGLDSGSDVREIRRMRLPAGTPVGELVDIHRQRVAAFLEDHAHAVPVPVRSERELRESWARMHAMKCAEMARNHEVDLQHQRHRNHTSSVGAIAPAISAARNAANAPAMTSSV
jgi:hypothetical protein